MNNFVTLEYGKMLVDDNFEASRELRDNHEKFFYLWEVWDSVTFNLAGNILLDDNGEFTADMHYDYTKHDYTDLGKFETLALAVESISDRFDKLHRESAEQEYREIEEAKEEFYGQTPKDMVSGAGRINKPYKDVEWQTIEK